MYTLHMPTVTRTGAYHVPNNTAYSQFSLNDIVVLIYDTKAIKHNIETHWPRAEQGRHTGILAEDQQSALKLYKQFASDFDYAFQKLSGQPIWIELQYAERELETQIMGTDVRTREFFQFKKLLVGASVTRQGRGCIVAINHGPYPI